MSSYADFMLSSKDEDDADGGPAFPKVPDDCRNGSSGMSLREWFAGQALPQAIQFEMSDGGRFQHFCEDSAKTIAEHAYLVADAMLAARRPGGQHPAPKSSPDLTETVMLSALKTASAEIGEWSRPKNSNGMTSPDESHPLLVANEIVKNAINMAEIGF